MSEPHDADPTPGALPARLREIRPGLRRQGPVLAAATGLVVAEVALLWLLGAALIGAGGTGVLQTLDQSLGPALRLAPGGAGYGVAGAVTWFGGPAVALPVVVVLALAARRERSWFPLVVWVASVVLAEATTQAAKRLVQRPRPPGALETDFAFPSGHTTMAAATFVVVALVLARTPRARAAWTTVAVLATAAVGWSRLALGAHWFSDVAVGAVVGWTWAVVAVRWCADAPATRPAPPAEATRPPVAPATVTGPAGPSVRRDPGPRPGRRPPAAPPG